MLNLLIWFPILSGLLVLCVGNDREPQLARFLTLFVIVLTLLACVPLYQQFNFYDPHMQFQVDQEWVPLFGMHYALGIDGLSLVLIVLTIFTNLIVVLATWDSIKQQVAPYLASFLIMQGLLVGVFSAMDAILFYLFWEATLIPMYLIIGIWGSANRVYAAIKFFLYTFLGSVLMLISFLYMGYQVGNFSIETFYDLKLAMGPQWLIFLSFFLAFAIKIPMFPVHTWLPDAHTEAPAGGSVVLAAILLKLGAYGFIRFALPIVPDACRSAAPWMIVLSLIAVIYIALVAMVQQDIKRLIAYSSISHMGFVTLGCFAIFDLLPVSGPRSAGLMLEGAIMIMISHAFISSGMFAGVGYLYDRLHTRKISEIGGVVNVMPVFATLFLFFSMANAGLPGTSGFVGEWMVILGSIQAGFGIACLAVTTLILSAAYTLWMVKRVIFGPVLNAHIENMRDLGKHELAAYMLLALMVVGMGVYPKPILDSVHQSVSEVLARAAQTKL